MAVATITVNIGHTVGHDNEAVGNDSILPLAEILGQYAHLGNMLEVMTRCGLVSDDTARVEMKRATCSSVQGSAWMTVVISGKAFLLIMRCYLDIRCKITNKFRISFMIGV